MAAALADRLQAHRSVLVGCYLATVALQGAMALVDSFAAQLALTAAAALVLTGASILGDAAVMAASSVSATASLFLPPPPRAWDRSASTRCSGTAG